MRPLALLLTVALLCISAAACEDGGDDPIITPGPAESFELTYVSGHLGNYWDCPQDALSSGPEAAGAPRPASEAADMAACEGDDCAPMILNCEHAEVTVRIRNTGEDTLSGLALTAIRLIGPDDGSTLDSSLVELIRADGGDLSDPIDAGAEIDVVVRFRGLTNDAYYQLFDGASGASFAPQPGVTVELDFESPSFNDTLNTPSLAMLPSVAT